MSSAWRGTMLAATVFVTLALPTVALSHGTVRPTVGESDQTVFTLTVPNVTINIDVEAVSLAAPAHTLIESVGAPRGFQTAGAGDTVRWIGGRLAPGETGTFRFRVFVENSGVVTLRGTESFAGLPTYDSEFPLAMRLEARTSGMSGTRVVVWVVGAILLTVAMLALLGFQQRRWGSRSWRERLR